MTNPVRFKCKCGAILSSAAYGKQVRCTKCQTVLVVPTPANRGAASQPSPQRQQAAATRQPVQQPVGQSFPSLQQTANRAPVKKKPTKKSNMGLWIGLGVVAAVLLLGGIGTAIFLVATSNNSKPQVAKKDGGNEPPVQNQGSSGPGNTSSKTPGNNPVINPGSTNSTEDEKIQYDFDKISLLEYSAKLPLGYQSTKMVENERGFSYTWRGQVRIDRTTPFINIQGATYANVSELNVAEMTAFSRSVRKRLYDDLKYSDEEKVTINGITFVRQEWTGVYREHRLLMKGIAYTTTLRNELLVIEFTAAEKHFQDYEKVFDDYLRSYRAKSRPSN